MPPGFASGGNFARSGANTGFGQMLGLGGGEPNFDSDQINALLQHFGGINVDSDYKPQGAFESMPWISKRAPSLAYGMDNALIALANMGPTGPTAGDNISNVARGLSAIGPTRQAQAMNPMLMAMHVAQSVAGLQQSAANIGRENAMAGWYNDRSGSAERVAALRAEATKYGADQRLQGAMARNAMLAGKEGMILSDGTVGLPDVDDDGHITYKSHPEIDPKAFVANQKKQKVAGIMGSSMGGLIAQGILGDDPDSYVRQDRTFGKVGAKGAAAYWQDANNILLQHATASAGVGAGSRADEGDKTRWASNQKEQFKNIYSGPGTAGLRDKRIKDRRQQIFEERNGSTDLSQAQHDAEWEAQQHQGRLQSLWGQFSMLNEDQQRAQGGIMGFLNQQGYDEQSDLFRNAPQGRPSPVPGLPAQGSGLDGYEMDSMGIPRPRAAKKP